MREAIALVTLAVILGIVNWSIVGKEKHLADGRIVYLELAPVDPRSLMQGDYMALHFALSDRVRQALSRSGPETAERRHPVTADGYAVVGLDARGVGTFHRLYGDDGAEPDNNEVLMRFRVRKGVVKFATNAYFFQEGQGKYFQAARYGRFRLDDKGELLLTGLYDKHLNKLIPAGENE